MIFFSLATFFWREIDFRQLVHHFRQFLPSFSWFRFNFRPFHRVFSLQLGADLGPLMRWLFAAEKSFSDVFILFFADIAVISRLIRNLCAL